MGIRVIFFATMGRQMKDDNSPMSDDGWMLQWSASDALASLEGGSDRLLVTLDGVTFEIGVRHWVWLRDVLNMATLRNQESEEWAGHGVVDG